MTRHLIDAPRQIRGQRLSRFLQIAREQAPHMSTRKLITRLREQADQRLPVYARIARGKQA